MKKINDTLIVAPIQTLRSIYGTRYTRPGFTAAFPGDPDAHELHQMDAPRFLPQGAMVRTGHPDSKEGIAHQAFYPRPDKFPPPILPDYALRTKR
ncbi:MAG: hypothetical protein IPK02_18135 [Candidatus Accumulibacter sp.]|uniref:Uncharacterized protein n=1 Tax=Candidatus Accumulibacter affinis TaxID=2954384 RepID=A0A935TG53_9PROT|nr:hypothetical protein [Candidatus Accumulibacter affinis]